MVDKLKVLYDNADFMVIDKPAGITVNRSDTTVNEKTLQDLIEEEGKIDDTDKSEEFISRAGIVHRLDKETSGAIIIAKNSTAFYALQLQFKERKVSKNYLALVHGEIKPSKGEINVPVGRLPWNRKRFGVLAGGREAVTQYETNDSYQDPDSKEALSLVRLFPKTGRTHQIRVHLKYINYPIVSDPLYGGRKTSRDDRKKLDRVFLHAAQITFANPKTNESITVDSPLPSELNLFIEKLLKTNNN